jgi:hypothetical protein
MAAPTFVDARFAGAIAVDLRTLAWDEQRIVVTVRGAAVDLDLFAHEAEALAAELTAYAAAAKKNAPDVGQDIEGEQQTPGKGPVVDIIPDSADARDQDQSGAS